MQLVQGAESRGQRTQASRISYEHAQRRETSEEHRQCAERIRRDIQLLEASTSLEGRWKRDQKIGGDVEGKQRVGDVGNGVG